MVAPLMAAAARAAAKSAAKKAAKGGAKSAGKAASRARKAGDESTIARKRYYRASERYLKKAEESSGSTAARYRQLAKQNFEDALATYDPANTQRYSKPIQRLASEFGYDLEAMRQLPTDGNDAMRLLEKRRIRQDDALRRSIDITQTSLKDPDVRREREAWSLFRSGDIGKRIIGGYVDVWREEATYLDESGQPKIDTRKIIPALYKHFGVDNMADLLDKVEQEVGEDLFRMGNAEEIYETVKLRITLKQMDNALVA